MHSCGWRLKLRNAGTVRLSLNRKMLKVLLVPYPTKRRICMLDVIIVLVTIVSFLVFIYFTIGCERL